MKSIAYQNKLEHLLKKVRPRLSSTHNLEFKPCFGAIAGYVNRNIFANYFNHIAETAIDFPAAPSLKEG